MRVVTLALASLGAVLGLAAAWWWWLASRVETTPVWGDREPGEQAASQAGWIAGLLVAANESARLNRRAAGLTAAAVLVSTLASVAGLFA
ncbi:MAG: hypothetical protein M3N82_02755 [Pseudomonadota bacterium]|nr:hypothetical protein [Pseudomonadota bacterium]